MRSSFQQWFEEQSLEGLRMSVRVSAFRGTALSVMIVLAMSATATLASRSDDDFLTQQPDNVAGMPSIPCATQGMQEGPVDPAWVAWTADGSAVVNARTTGSDMTARVIATLQSGPTRDMLSVFQSHLRAYEECLRNRGRQPQTQFVSGGIFCNLETMPQDLVLEAGSFFAVDQRLAHLCFTSLLVGQFNNREPAASSTLLALAERLGGMSNCTSTVPLYERALAVLENQCRAAGKPGKECIQGFKETKWRKLLDSCRALEWSGGRVPLMGSPPLVFVKPADTEAERSTEEKTDGVTCKTCQCVTSGCVRTDSIVEYLSQAKSSLQQYLARGRYAFFSQETVHAVLGNESGDLDSVISAIVHAFHMWRTRNPQDMTLYVPVLNMRRRDFESRGEVVRVLKSVGIRPEEHLVFIDGSKVVEGPLELSPSGMETDVDDGAGFLEQLLDDGLLRITLVDHNAPTPRQSHIETAIVDVIDHHAEEAAVKTGLWGLDDIPPFMAYRKTIVRVGSCATLVSERMISETPRSVVHGGIDEGVPFIDCVSARLLLNAIIADTHALNVSRGSTTPRDVDAVNSLVRACPGALDGKDPFVVYAELVAAKEDVAAMPTVEILARDFKQAACGRLLLGVSAVPIAIHKLAARPDFESAATEFVAGRRLDLYAIISDQKGKRKLALAAVRDNPVARAAVESFGESNDAEELQLTPLKERKADRLKAAGFVAYKQQNSNASRKVIFPLLRKHIEDCLYG